MVSTPSKCLGLHRLNEFSISVNNVLANTLAGITNFEVAGETGSVLHQTAQWDCLGDAFLL